MTEQQKRKYRYFLGVLLTAACCAMIWMGWKYLDDSIPDQLYVYRDDDQPLKILEENPFVELSDTTTVSGSGSYQVTCRVFGKIPLKNVKVTQMDRRTVYASGTPVGIYLETSGVMVIDSGAVKTTDGTEVNPAEHIVKSGDYIVAVNGTRILYKKELIQMVSQCKGEDMELLLLRDGMEVPVLVKPVLSEDGNYKLGIWVRDNLQGIGTLTYMEEDGSFGALGHGISDVDTGRLLQLKDGELYQAEILSIVKGKNGSPGELQGVINYQSGNKIGLIDRNQNIGIYGKILQDAKSDIPLKKYEIGLKQEMQKGRASILSCVDGTVKEYEIEISDITWNKQDSNKSFTIRVTDPELLELTGGIVQGMSGSPVIQNGKIVGAVTHVFIQDSAKGYGIFIENMLDSGKNSVVK